MTKFINPFQIHNFTILMRCCCLVFKYIPSSPRYFEAGQCSVTLREGYSALFCVVVLSIEPSKAIEKKVPPLSVDSLFRHSRKTLFVYSSTIIRNETPPIALLGTTTPVFGATRTQFSSAHKTSTD